MDKQEQMKKAGRKISILMGVTMSLGLSLVGNLTSGHFTVPGFLISFLMSTAVSLVIGFLLPMGRITRGASRGLRQKPGSFGAKCIESLVSDLIYTPLITFLMVLFAYKQATAQGAPVKFLPMFLPSLLICFIVGFVLIFIFQPLYTRLVLKGSGAPDGAEQPPAGQNGRGPAA